VNATRMRRTVLGMVLVAAAVVGGSAANGQAAAGCTMTVSSRLVASHTYRTGVVWQQYRVTATRGALSQTAVVQLSVMPSAVRPRLLSTKLGWADEIRDQVSTQQPKALAAVNGGFFFEYRLAGGGRAVLPRDGAVRSGAVRSAGTRPTPVVGVDTAGHPYVGTLATTGSVTSRAGTFTVTGVNWRDLGSRDVVVYTPAWADRDTSRPAGDVEWVLSKDGTITGVRNGRGNGAPVAARTRVVAFGASWADAAARAKPGERATVAVRQLTSTGATLREAVGRGRLLVDHGAVAITCQVPNNGPRPRTTVGWNGHGRWMTMIVPGTGYDHSGYRIGGLGPTADAAVAQALGFRVAVEMDGGGSVTSYVRTGTRWNRLDDSDKQWQRPVPTGLAFVRT
jgi:hypothetical protein